MLETMKSMMEKLQCVYCTYTPNWNIKSIIGESKSHKKEDTAAMEKDEALAEK